MTDLLAGHQVVSLVGRQGAGKSFLGGKLAALLHCGRVEVSDVVKSLYKNLPREELPLTSMATAENADWLGELVAENILVARERSGSPAIVVLTGARETQVHRFLERNGAATKVVEIYCNPFTRCDRLIRDGKVKNEAEFLAHEARESDMGIVNVLSERYARVHTSELSDPDDLMRKLLTSLNKRGVSA